MGIKKVVIVEIEVGASGTDHLETAPSRAKFILKEKDVEKIKLAAKHCVENEWAEISIWDTRVEYLLEGGGDPVRDAGLKLEGEKMVVSRHDFCFRAVERRTSGRVWTEYIQIADLLAVSGNEESDEEEWIRHPACVSMEKDGGKS